MKLREPQAPSHLRKFRANGNPMKNKDIRNASVIIFRCLNQFAPWIAQPTRKIVRYEVLISELSRPPAMAGED
ncbi:MAG: hypothetical protein RL695_1356 [Pseudomonadota bacterium]|jgi:hypothetical protein